MNKNEQDIKRDNIIVSDGLSGYSYLDISNSGYLASIHTNALGDFGARNDSTAYIDQLWVHLKHLIKKIYNTNSKFCFLLKETGI